MVEFKSMKRKQGDFVRLIEQLNRENQEKEMKQKMLEAGQNFLGDE